MTEIYRTGGEGRELNKLKRKIMEIEEKLVILKSLDTRKLIEATKKYENELETALRETASFKDLNRGYLSSTGDCQEAKKLLAEIRVQAPETNKDNKKLTAADKDDWLQRQRTENQELAAAIAKQGDIAFLLESDEIKCATARHRLAGAIAVLALKTQQLAFLAGS